MFPSNIPNHGTQPTPPDKPDPTLPEEYHYLPSAREAALALDLIEDITPTPRIEFIAARTPNAANYIYRVLRITNPANGKSQNYSATMTLLDPTPLINDLPALDLVYRPPVPAPIAPTTVYTGFAPIPPGGSMGMFGPIAPPK